MSVLAMERSSDAPGTLFDRSELVAQINSKGVHLENVRAWFLKLSESAELNFRSVNAAGHIEADSSPADILFWSWVPLFSLRAKTLLNAFCASDDDFVRCRVGGGEVYYAHLPYQAEDVFDFAKSKFSMLIPLTPPLPFGLIEAKRAAGRADATLPYIFRSKIPNHEQVLSELLVRDELAQSWLNSGMFGASFRKVCM